MGIEAGSGNLLKADVEALVNTVNCVGFMGKGIALQFRQAFPENFATYQKAVRAEEVRIGRMLVHEMGFLDGPKYIINFPTKRHWRGKSRIEDIRSGLAALIEVVQQLGIRSIAIPPLGCGLGGLDWKVVRPMIERAFETLPEVHVLLFEPVGAPDARSMPVRTKRPQMTSARALLVKLMQQYQSQAYRLTLLEIQKLAYFLQEAGEPMKLKYEAGHYGPYATNLNKVLERMEGHFTRGYGDSQQPDVEIELLSGAVDEAEQFLEESQDSLQRLDRVAKLIEGFESPYGMELLASVHWVKAHGQPAARGSDEAIASVQAWTPRKKQMFRPEHIRVAWERLNEEQWLFAGSE